MALPTMTNILIDGTATGGVQRPDIAYDVSNGTVSLEVFPDQTAKVLASPTIGAANLTCNLATDTILYRADGGIWDDTQQCWVSVDLTNLSGTPRI